MISVLISIEAYSFANCLSLIKQGDDTDAGIVTVILPSSSCMMILCLFLSSLLRNEAPLISLDPRILELWEYMELFLLLECLEPSVKTGNNKLF